MRRLVRPVALDERLADHRHGLAIARVAVVDVAPALERNTQRREVTRRHVAQDSAFLFARAVDRPRRRLDRHRPDAAAHRPIGRKLTKPAFATPGSARTLCEHARVERLARRRRCRTAASAGGVCSVSTPSGLNPGSMPCTVSSARISSPAETSSTTDATISTTTSAERSRSFCPPPARAPSRRPVEIGARRRRAARARGRTRGR